MVFYFVVLGNFYSTNLQRASLWWKTASLRIIASSASHVSQQLQIGRAHPTKDVVRLNVIFLLVARAGTLRSYGVSLKKENVLNKIIPKY